MSPIQALYVFSIPFFPMMGKVYHSHKFAPLLEIEVFQTRLVWEFEDEDSKWKGDVKVFPKM